MSFSSWSLYAGFILLQSLSFTIVSRARNSGSLRRHVFAALFSNLIWFCAQVFTIENSIGIIRGDKGFWFGAATCATYTSASVLGSILAHFWALRSEKGKSAVGANDKYAQITKEEWSLVIDKVKAIEGQL